MDKIGIYIPNYNGGHFLKDVEIPLCVDVLVMDNMSTDDSKNICLNRGFNFIENDRFVERTENWIRCLNHFKNSDYDWMKWLFVGDELWAESWCWVKSAVQEYGGASVIIFDYSVLYNGKLRERKLDKLSTGYWNPQQYIENILRKGNVFGSPIGYIISKNANLSSVEKSGLDWAEDFHIMLQLTKGSKIAYVDKNIGVFHADKRKYYKKNNKSYISTVEYLQVMREIIVADDYNGLNKKEIARKNVMNKMQYCIENNVCSWMELLELQVTVFRCFLKQLLKK